MIFLSVKDIDEWNILSLKNSIIVKKEKIKNDEISNFLSTIFGDKPDLGYKNSLHNKILTLEG